MDLCRVPYLMSDIPELLGIGSAPPRGTLQVQTCAATTQRSPSRFRCSLRSRRNRERGRYTSILWICRSRAAGANWCVQSKRGDSTRPPHCGLAVFLSHCPVLWECSQSRFASNFSKGSVRSARSSWLGNQYLPSWWSTSIVLDGLEGLTSVRKILPARERPGLKFNQKMQVFYLIWVSWPFGPV